MNTFLDGPGTSLGKWSMRLLAAFVLLMCVFFALMRTVPLPGHYVRLWVPLISAAASAVAAGVVAVVAIFRRERSILMLLPLLVAAFVLFFAIGEMNEGTNPCKDVKGPCVITTGPSVK